MMKRIKTIGVVGAGTMGSALAQKFAQSGFSVILADREMQFVNKGKDNVRAMLDQGVKRGLFTLEHITTIMRAIKGTADLNDLSSCDMIVEAIYENFDAKFDLFKVLEGIVERDTILATNTSSFSVDDLSKALSYPDRFIGLHYFFHAAKNRLVEIIPGEHTSKEVTKGIYRFCGQSGKDPIYTADANGFAINRFFVPWLNEAVRLLEDGVASIDQIDAISMKVFKIGMGPFALMNATGVPIAMHAQRTLEVFGPYYKVCGLLEQQVEKNEDWKLSADLNVDFSEETYKIVADRLLGSVFYVCSQIIEEKVCTPGDLNRGARIGLRWRKGPVDLMLHYGETEVKRLVKQLAAKYHVSLPESMHASFWNMEYITLEKEGRRAVITINRPEDLNALNEDVVRQLEEAFDRAEKDAHVEDIFITGSGKAFVAGADIGFFVKNMKGHTLDNILSFTKYGQEVLEKIDHSNKKIVIVLNGLTLGGGLELALCADVLLAVPKVKMAFPETGIGIYPGLGGTQRSRSRIGKGLSKYLILTGKMINAKDAAAIGLIDAVVDEDIAFDIMEGKLPVPERNHIELSEKWSALRNLYDRNSYKNIISGQYVNGGLDKQLVMKLGKTMSFKAPIAMDIAEQLIEEARGPKSELEKLVTIFATDDAKLGLTSIGKRVEYQGK
jgi:enoyl-CoA hydratase/3-hydroxyacyl-CoA dehydrogenase